MLLRHMTFGQILPGQMLLGHLSTVKDGSTNFSWVGEGGGLVKVEIDAHSVQLNWSWDIAWQKKVKVSSAASCLNPSLRGLNISFVEQPRSTWSLVSQKIPPGHLEHCHYRGQVRHTEYYRYLWLYVI